jgi:uncharacterized protein YbjT (DUF2867 family)
MSRILITGATGNIGQEVIHYLTSHNAKAEVYAAVRKVEEAKESFQNYPSLLFRQFDFEDHRTFPDAFQQMDMLFLLRPPHLSEIKRIFKPLLNAAKEAGISKVVFLSVQGVEKSKVIPHHKIENLIREMGFNYIFLRPGYFMQNLTTTLRAEIVDHKRITLPSGKAKFNWIDVKNIGEAAAELILHFDKYRNQAYELTGIEKKDFYEVAALMSDVTNRQIEYRSINPLSFYLKKRKEGDSSGLAVVMTILHFLPRFQAEPEITDNYQILTEKDPTTLNEFIEREKDKFSPPQTP